MTLLHIGNGYILQRMFTAVREQLQHATSSGGEGIDKDFSFFPINLINSQNQTCEDGYNTDYYHEFNERKTFIGILKLHNFYVVK